MIASEGEQKSAKALMEAARIMASSPSALQLRQLYMIMIIVVVMMMMKTTVFAMMVAFQILANSALNLCGEEQHNHFPTAHGAPWRVR